jgi:hypothetical protein
MPPVADGTRSHNALLAGALEQARAGRPVFPCWWPAGDQCACGNPACPSPAKHPLAGAVPHGFRDASADLGTIERWWRRWPLANVAMPTGRMSGLLVLDVDAHRGGDATLAALERQHGALPPAPRVHTPQGGVHLYFRMPARSIPSRTDVAPGIDVRADGGYVLVPPSRGLPGPYLDEIRYELR